MPNIYLQILDPQYKDVHRRIVITHGSVMVVAEVSHQPPTDESYPLATVVLAVCDTEAPDADNISSFRGALQLLEQQVRDVLISIPQHIGTQSSPLIAAAASYEYYTDTYQDHHIGRHPRLAYEYLKLRD
jgi:hypothetical protein